MKTINVSGLSQYKISEDGQIYSELRKRWIKPLITISGYITYSLFNTILNQRGIYSVSKLVAITYIGNPPGKNYIASHKDYNRQNNHYTNLQWITRSENIIRNNNGNISFWSGDTKLPQSIKSRIQKSNGSRKRIAVYQWGKYLTTYESIKLLCEDMKIDRDKYDKIFRGKSKKLCKRYSFKVIDDKITECLD